ncbi:MAG TPA: hypothetical protein DEP84_00830 [Chloroflexi bacterium]|nr:hypothetical protein [Chloroflexota bacterium]
MLLVLLLAGTFRNIVGIAVSVATIRHTAADLWGTVTGVIRASGSSADLLVSLLLPMLALVLGWAAALGLIGGLLLASALILWPLLPVTRRGHRVGEQRVAQKGVLDQRVLLVSLVTSGYQTSLLAINSFFVLYLVEVLDISPVLSGAYLAVSQLMAVVGQIIWGVVGDRGVHSGKKTILAHLGVGTALGLLALAALPARAGAAALLIVSAFLGLTALASWGVITALILDVSDVERAGNANALFATFVYSVGAISPLLFGLIVEATDSFRIAFRLFAIITLGSAIALWFLPLKPAPEPDVERDAGGAGPAAGAQAGASQNAAGGEY